MVRIKFSGTITMWVSLLAIALTSQVGNAQEKPWKVAGEGSGSEGFSLLGADSPFQMTGTASLLGRYTGEGVAIATGPGTFKGTFTFVAANGDELATTFGDDGNGRVGEFFAIPADDGLIRIMFVAEFNPVPEDSGRFADVTGGSVVLTAVSEPILPVLDSNGFTEPFSFQWEGDGWLEFFKGKGRGATK